MINCRPVRLVLFDIDGTLVDHDGAAAAAVEQWLMANRWANPGTTAALVADWDAIAESHFSAYRAGLTTFQGQRRLRLRDLLPLVGIDASTWSDERLDDLFNTYLVAYEGAWRSFPDAEPCLRALRHAARPDPRAFELACGRLGVPRRAVVYVGDQLEVDARAATAAGLRGIWLNRPGGEVPPGVEAIDSLADLPGMLETCR